MRLLLGIPFILAALGPYRQMTTLAFIKPLPVIGDKAFTAKFQVVIANKGTVMYALEQYDETQNKASLTTIKDDNADMLILDYTAQTLTTVKYSVSTNQLSQCYIFGMQTAKDVKYKISDNFHLFGDWQKTSAHPVPHMFSTKNMLSMNTTSPITYKGVTTIDGIKADYWKTSMQWEDDQDTFDVLYYFTPKNWAPAESNVRSLVYPLRIQVIGSKITKSGVKHFDHYYEYLDFVTSDRLQPSAFDIPGGGFCDTIGKVNMKKTPTPPDAVSYSREIVDGMGNVDFADVSYDKNKGLMSIDGSRGKVVFDLNYGVQYDVTNYPCKIRAMNPDGDKTLSTTTHSVGDYITDMSPTELWFLNRTLVYRGQGHKRNIGTNIYGASINDEPFDAYFGKLNWKFTHNANNPPISIFMYGKHYNFFNFKSNSLPLLQLGTQPVFYGCGIRVETLDLKFNILGDVTREELFSQERLAKMTNAIASHAGLDLAQVYVYDQGYFSEVARTVSFTVILSGPPPAQYLYRRNDHREVEANNLKSVSKTLDQADYDVIIENSATVCENTTSQTSFVCRNYDLCRNEDNSFSMKMYSTLPSYVSIVSSSTCNHFSRNIDGKPQISLKAAISKLRDSVNSGSLEVAIQIQGDGVKLVALGFDKTKESFYNTESYDGFIKVPFASATNTETTRTYDIKDCGQLCLSRASYRCKGFSWCPLNQCVLSDAYPQRKSNSTDYHSCYTYKRPYLADFRSMGQLTLNKEDTNDVYKDVKDADSCAMKCIHNKKYDCKSFNYCKGTNECLLSKKHVYSMHPVQKGNSACDHYSKDYLVNFKVSKNTALTFDDKHSLETIAVSSPEKCAYLCQNNYAGKGCVQFDFCKETSLCQIVTIKTRSYVSHLAKASCDTFTLANAVKVEASGKKGTTYSDVSFAGLAIGMIFLGLALGAGIIYILHRQRYISRIIG